MLNQTNRSSFKQTATIDQGLKSYMLGIYNYMSVALFITGIVAYLASSTPAFFNLLYNVSSDGSAGLSLFGMVTMFAPLAIVFAFSFGINSMKASTVQLLFWVYATVMGLSMSSIFLIYTSESIAKTFFISGSMFGAASLYGYTSKKDLTNFGSFLMMGLFGIIIASLINIFFKSSAMEFAISILGVIIFTGLTAYDTQKLKNMYYNSNYQGAAEGNATKMSIMGALTLYLDFINIFMMLLRFLGNRKD